MPTGSARPASGYTPPVIARLAVACLVVLLAACNPVITNSSDYRTAGARTAGDASAQVASAAMAAQLAIDDRAFASYLSVVTGDAEDALSGIQNTFGSLQPPTEQAVVLREQLLDLLSQAQDDVAGVRIAIQAGDVPPPELVDQLTGLQDDLDQMAGELQ